MTSTSLIHNIALGLTVIGGLNWGSIGLFDCNLVTAVLGETLLARVVYTLVGLSALYVAIAHLKAAGDRAAIEFEG